MNRYILVGTVLFLQSIFAIGQAQSKVSVNHKFARYFDSHLQTQLRQALPLRLLNKVGSGEIIEGLLANEAYVICSEACTIDKLYGGYKSRKTDLSQRVSSLGSWTEPIPRAENNFHGLKESIYNHIEEIFSDSGILKYSKLDGSVIMIRGGIWYQYPFSFDGYANETITIADTIIKDTANTFQLRTDTQPTRSFSANLVLRIGNHNTNIW